MALDIKKVAKTIALIANAASVTVAGLQTSGVLAGLSPSVNALLLGVLAVLNAVAHALPQPTA